LGYIPRMRKFKVYPLILLLSILVPARSSLAECFPGEALARAEWAQFKKPKVVVIVKPFTNYTKGGGLQWLSTGLAELAGSYLTSAKGVGVMYGLMEMFPPQDVQPIYTVSGTYQITEESIRVYLKTYKAGLEEPFSVEWFSISPPDTALIFRGMERLIGNFMKKAKLSYNKKVLEAEVTATQSFDAFSSYIKGLEAMRKFDPKLIDIAEIWLLDAIKVDPYYQKAYTALTDLYGYLYLEAKAEGRPYDRFLERLSQFETTRTRFSKRPLPTEDEKPKIIKVEKNPKVTNRFLIGNSNYIAGLEAMKNGDLKGAAKLLEAATSAVPEDIVAYRLLRDVYIELGRKGDADKASFMIDTRGICR